MKCNVHGILVGTAKPLCGSTETWRRANQLLLPKACAASRSTETLLNWQWIDSQMNEKVIFSFFLLYNISLYAYLIYLQALVLPLCNFYYC